MPSRRRRRERSCRVDNRQSLSSRRATSLKCRHRRPPVNEGHRPTSEGRGMRIVSYGGTSGGRAPSIDPSIQFYQCRVRPEDVADSQGSVVTFGTVDDVPGVLGSQYEWLLDEDADVPRQQVSANAILGRRWRCYCRGVDTVIKGLMVWGVLDAVVVRQRPAARLVGVTKHDRVQVASIEEFRCNPDVVRTPISSPNDSVLHPPDRRLAAIWVVLCFRLFYHENSPDIFSVGIPEILQACEGIILNDRSGGRRRQVSHNPGSSPSLASLRSPLESSPGRTTGGIMRRRWIGGHTRYRGVCVHDSDLTEVDRAIPHNTR